MHRVVSVGDQLHASGHQLRELVEDARGRLGVVRDGAMGLAMVPVRRVVAAFPRLVRDVASSTGKDVGLNLVGEDVELDKRVLGRRRRRAEAPGHQRGRPRLRDTRGADRGRQAAARHRHRVGEVGRLARWCSRSPTTDAASTRTSCARRPSRRGCCRRAARCPGRSCCKCCSCPASRPRRRSPRPRAAASVWTSCKHRGRRPRRRHRRLQRTRLGTTLQPHAADHAWRFALPDRPASATSGTRSQSGRDGVAQPARRSGRERGGRSDGGRHGVDACRSLDLGDALGVDGVRDPRAALVVRNGGAQDLHRVVGRPRSRASSNSSSRTSARSSGGCRSSPARRSTATAAWCCSSTCARSPVAAAAARRPG